MLHNFKIKNNKLFIGGISAENLVARYGSPLYVYDTDIIKRQYQEIVKNISYPKKSIHFACKANVNIELLKLLRQEGCKLEAVSKGEILAGFEAGFLPEEIIYTCSYVTKEELQFVIDNDILLNVDSLKQLEIIGQIYPGKKICIRLNQGIGAGHHTHTITGGPNSKFGIDISEINKVKRIAKKYKLQIIGVHQHIGSGYLDANLYMKSVRKLLDTARKFEGLDFVDFGGGFGITYSPKDKPLNMVKLGKLITKEIERFNRDYGKEIEIKFEPGRFLVGESGVLLSTVTEIKKSPYNTFVGIDAGFNQLIRPMMYGSYHEIVNAGKIKGKDELVWVVGNICESGDIFASDRKLSSPKEGDILAILDAGAYGYAMSFLYNGRHQLAEILVEGESTRLIRKKRSFLHE